jgi:hypothetical protein
MNKAEEILRTYIDFEDVNGSEPITLLPLTVIDAMEEYFEIVDKKSYTIEEIEKAIDDLGFIYDNVKEAIINNLKQINNGSNRTRNKNS